MSETISPNTTIAQYTIAKLRRRVAIKFFRVIQSPMNNRLECGADREQIIRQSF